MSRATGFPLISWTIWGGYRP